MNSQIKIRINSGARRAGLIGVGFVCLAAAYFGMKWGFANTIAARADILEVAELSTDLAPDDPQTHYSLAVLRDKTFEPGDSEAAILEFETAAALAPHNYLLWLELGKALERTGEQERAERVLRQAQALAPEYASVRWALGNALLRQGKTDDAFAEIRKAVAGNDTFATPAATIAWQILDGDIGRVKAAIGDSQNTRDALVTILLAEKRFDEAVATWNGLPEENKKTNLKNVGDKLAAELIAAKRFRQAVAVANDIKSGEAAISSIRNGGFEVNEFNASVFDWLITGGTVPQITLSSGVKRSGNYSLLVAFGSTTEKNFRTISQTVAVDPGRSCELSFHYRANIETQSAIKWEIVNAIDGSVLTTVKLAEKTVDWTAASAIFKVPMSTDGIVLRLAVENCGYAVCSTSGNLWFDDFTLNVK